MKVTVENLKGIKPDIHYAVFISNRMVDTIFRASASNRIYDIVTDSWTIEEYAQHGKNKTMYPFGLIKPPKELK